MERSVIVIDVSLYNQTKFQKTEYYVPALKASLDYVCPDDPVIGMTFTLKDSKFCLVLTSLYIS